MTKSIITELEGIQILIEAGLSNGEEMETSFYKKKNYINSDASLDAFLEKLEQIFTHAKLVINPKSKKGNPYSGRKRLIELGERREVITERENNYSNCGGSPTQNENDILMEYFFGQLVKRVTHKDGYSETYGNWGSAKWINQIEITSDDWKEFGKTLDELFNNHNVITDDIKNDFKNVARDNLNRNNRELAIGFIKKLEDRGSIETELEFVHKYDEGGFVVEAQKQAGNYPVIHQKVSEDTRIHVVADIEKVLEPFGVPFGRYKIVSAFKHFAKDDNEREAVHKVNEMLLKDWGIDYLYNMIRIHVVDDSLLVEVSQDEARAAYERRIIKLTSNRMNRKGYESTGVYTKAFYRLIMFSLLKLKGVKGLENQIDADEKIMHKTLGNIFCFEVNNGNDLVADIERQKEKEQVAACPDELSSILTDNSIISDCKDISSEKPVKEVEAMKQVEHNISPFRETEMDYFNRVSKTERKYKDRKKSNEETIEKVNIPQKPMPTIDISQIGVEGSVSTEAKAKEAVAFGNAFNRNLPERQEMTDEEYQMKIENDMQWQEYQMYVYEPVILNEYEVERVESEILYGELLMCV